MLSIPGDCRDFDQYQKILFVETGDLLGVPNDPLLQFKIEISDEPMPESYWLTINDTLVPTHLAPFNFSLSTFSSDNYILLDDVKSRGVNLANLKPIKISTQEFE